MTSSIPPGFEQILGTEPESKPMRILAIDPGTNCGWATSGGDTIISGTWNLKGGRFEGAGMRFVRLRKLLDEFGPLDRIVFEEVRAHRGTDAAHIYGGIIAVIMAWCEEHGTPYEGIPVGTIKKHATGKGNSKKDAMVAAAKQRWPDFDGDDNEADARWMLDFVFEGEAK
jgi:crossover junction endodeoxyribonuclease RuvC